MEHHSNIVPWQLLCQDTGAELRYLDGDRRRRARRSTSSTRCSPTGRVKLVAVAHVSNVLGTINPVAEIVRARPRRGRRDRSSTARRRCRSCRWTWRAIDADFYAWTGHKALGPTGVGVLHGRRELLEAMRPVPRRRRT